MYLPNIDRAVVAKEKITHYLLDITSQKGGPKARFFMRFGFSIEKWEVFEEAVRRQAREVEIARIEQSEVYGVYYIIEERLVAPDGRRPFVRTVWLVDEGEDFPRLISVVPISGGG